MLVLPSVGDDFGRYHLLRELGRGGMGVVYAARDAGLDREVAVKIIAPQLAADDDFRARFRREALTLSRVDSPHVVAVHDHGEIDGCLYLVTQLVTGGDLLQHLRREGALPPQVAVDLVAQVLAGLSDAHGAGVVHRDVKPSNVLLRRRDGRLEAVLCDFGIATTADGQLTHTGHLVGSFPYMAPERHQGEPADGAADVYSVGCLLWHLLTGTPPYAGSDVEIALAHLQAPVPQLPPSGAAAVATNQVLTRAMAKRPDDRYRSARAMRADVLALASLLGADGLALPDVTSVRHSLALGTPPPPPPAVGAPGRSRRRAGLVAASVAGLLALSGVLYAAVLASGDEPPARDSAETVLDVVIGEDPTTTAAPGPSSSAPGATSPSATPSRGSRGRQGGRTTAPAPTGSTGSSTPSGSSGSSGSTGSSGSGAAPSSGPTRRPTSRPTRPASQPTTRPTTRPTPQPSPTQAPEPQPTWRCWDGSTAFAYDDCSLPTGRTGLRWVFGDIARLSCYDSAAEAGGRVAGITCALPTGSGTATVYFLEWSSQRAARSRFDEQDDASVWRDAWGYQWFWTTRNDANHAKLYASLPFSMRIEAGTVRQRERAVERLSGFRAPGELRAEPI